MRYLTPTKSLCSYTFWQLLKAILCKVDKFIFRESPSWSDIRWKSQTDKFDELLKELHKETT